MLGNGRADPFEIGIKCTVTANPRNPKRFARGRLTTFGCTLQSKYGCSAGADMGATRRRLATIPHQTRPVAAVLPAFRQIGFIPSRAILPPAAKGWMNAVRGARAKALSLVIASALCASPAWSAKRAAKSNVPVEYAIPSCDDPAVLGQIAAEFNDRHWAVGFGGMRGYEVGRKEYWPYADMQRRFCEGVVKPLRGAERPGCKYVSPSFYPVCYPIYYAIIANDPGYQLEWCAVGLDRAWPVDPRCRLARP
jgi:hypothetical protein